MMRKLIKKLIKEEFDWIDFAKSVPKIANYEGHPQGVVYVRSHDEINEFIELLTKYNKSLGVSDPNPCGFSDRSTHYMGKCDEFNKAFEYRRDELEVMSDEDDFDYGDTVLSMSFFVEKRKPHQLLVGYWSYEVDEDDVNEWLEQGDTLNKDFNIYQNLSEVKSIFSNLISESEEDDFGWVKDIKIGLSPNTAYYFIPPLNIEEMDILSSKIEDNGYIGVVKEFITSPNLGDYENSDLIMLLTNDDGVVDAWQNSGEAYVGYEDEDDIWSDEAVKDVDDLMRILDDNDGIHYDYVDGREIFFNKNINESDELSWMDDIPAHQKMYIELDDYTFAVGLLDELLIDGYTYVSRVAKYRGDEVKSGRIMNHRTSEGSRVAGIIVNLYAHKINRIVYNSDIGVGKRYDIEYNSEIHTREYLSKLPKISSNDFIKTYIDNIDG